MREFAEIVPIERVVTPEGERVLAGVHLSNPNLMDSLIDHLREATGADIQVLDRDQLRSSSVFGPPTRWNAPWEPTGPKPNWLITPPDPSNN